MFSARLINHSNTQLLNICDSNLLGRTLIRDKFSIKISESYYGERIVEKDEAENLLRKCDNINMVGKGIGVGSQDGVKEIDGIPFLIVFKM